MWATRNSPSRWRRTECAEFLHSGLGYHTDERLPDQGPANETGGFAVLPRLVLQASPRHRKIADMLKTQYVARKDPAARPVRR